MSDRTTGLVLAAGLSRRLGRPKQLLPYGSGTLLGHVLDTARACRFDQLLCVVPDGLEHAPLAEGVELLVNRHSGEGCSSSIAVALGAVDPRSEVLVLMLGDQPGVSPDTVGRLLAGLGSAPLAACAYEDARGHPLAFRRELFGELAGLHGDKGVWKLLDRHATEVVEVAVPGPVPLDVDTWEDYKAVLSQAAIA